MEETKIQSPLSDELSRLRKLVSKNRELMGMLIDTMGEALAKPFVLNLHETNQILSEKIKELHQLLKDQGFIDIMYVNPKYKDTFTPKKFR